MEKNRGRNHEIEDENPEWTKEDFARAKPASEVLSPDLLAMLPKRKPGQRGKQVSPKKELVAIRIDADIVQRFRAHGRGWQTKMNSALKEWAREHQI
jgi:uncharacterized protein (DUF4415 family)